MRNVRRQASQNKPYQTTNAYGATNLLIRSRRVVAALKQRRVFLFTVCPWYLSSTSTGTRTAQKRRHPHVLLIMMVSSHHQLSPPRPMTRSPFLWRFDTVLRYSLHAKALSSSCCSCFSATQFPTSNCECNDHRWPSKCCHTGPGHGCWR